MFPARHVCSVEYRLCSVQLFDTGDTADAPFYIQTARICLECCARLAVSLDAHVAHSKLAGLHCALCDVHYMFMTAISPLLISTMLPLVSRDMISH